MVNHHLVLLGYYFAWLYLNTLCSYSFRSIEISNAKLSEIVALHLSIKRTRAIIYVQRLLLMIRRTRMQLKLDFSTNMMMKFHRKIWDTT